MQIFFKQNLAFLAVPKTGSTAFEMALRGHADIIFAKRRKHMTAGQFDRRFAPFLQEQYNAQPERMAVIRNPLEQIRSWYRYRTSPKSGRKDAQTSALSFDEFVQLVMQTPQPPVAAIGSQFGFLTRDSKLAVHHLFAYEVQNKLRGFLEERFEQDLTFPIKNVSPPKDAPISPDIEAALRASRPEEFALYDRVMDAGGHLMAFGS